MIKTVVIIFIWIVHISALIGLALGYEDFFLSKSPWTMILLLVTLTVYFPINQLKQVALFFLCMVVGMGVEWIGVHTGWLFGEYSYGYNFGPKLDGIPYLIGVNWAILTFCGHRIALHFFDNKWMIAASGAGFLVFLDFFLEQICDYADYWTFTGGAGWYNYVCWFVIAYTLQLAAYHAQLKGDLKISSHLYASQLTFATILWIIISTT